jgi:hypothetical protein
VSVGAMLGPWWGGMMALSHVGVGRPYVWPYLVVLGVSGILMVSLIAPFRSKESFIGSQPSVEKTPQILSDAQVSIGWIFRLREMGRLVTRPEARRIFGILVLSQISWASFYEFAPAILKLSFHATPAIVGRFQAMVAVWLMLASGVLLPWIQKRCSHLRLLQGALILLGLGVLMAFVMTWFPGQEWAKLGLWVSAIPTAMGDVMLYSVLMTQLSLRLPGNVQGRVMGCVYVMIGVAWSCSGLAGGLLLAHCPEGPFWYAPLGAGLALLLTFGSQSRENSTCS